MQSMGKRARLVLFAAAIASCDQRPSSESVVIEGSSSRQGAGDDCERAGTKLFGAKSVAAEVYEYEHQPGKTRPPGGKRQADWIESCRKAQLAISVPLRNRTSVRAMRDGLVEVARQNVDCILPADTDDQIYNCFVAYMKNAPLPEPVVVLKQIAALATETYRATGAFPKGSTPLTPTCGSHGNSPWTHPTWQALGLRVDDELLNLHYRYASDGKTFRAEAWRNIDCDPDTRLNQEAAFVASGMVVDGDVKTFVAKSAAR